MIKQAAFSLPSCSLVAIQRGRNGQVNGVIIMISKIVLHFDSLPWQKEMNFKKAIDYEAFEVSKE
jgi:hypothetical protein